MLGPGGLARVDAATIRRFRNTSDSEEAVYLCVGGAEGYVGRDGRTVGDQSHPLEIDVDVEPGRLGEAEALVEARREVRVRVEVRELGAGREARARAATTDMPAPTPRRRASAQDGDAGEVEARAGRAVGAQRVGRAGRLAVERRERARSRARRRAAARASACCRSGSRPNAVESMCRTVARSSGPARRTASPGASRRGPEGRALHRHHAAAEQQPRRARHGSSGGTRSPQLTPCAA